MIPVLFYLPGACSFGSIVALEWLSEPYRLCRLDSSTIGSEAYRKLNPLAQVPLFKSGEGLLSESSAILQHLEFHGLKKKMGFHEGTKDYDHLNQVMSFLTTGLHSAFSPIIHPDRFADDESAQADVKHKAMKETVPARLKHIEQTINRYGWLVANHPMVADAYFYGVARQAASYVDIDKDFPKIASLFSKLKTDPAVMFAENIERGVTAKSAGGFKGEAQLSEF